MVSTEMIQTGAQMASAKPSTPPSSPSQSPSEQLVTLNNVHQFIDMVKAVVAMEIASTPKCTCSDAPSENAHPQASTQPLTLENLEQLILKLIDAKSKPLKSSESAKPDAHPEVARASKLEYKTVTEVYASNSSLRKHG
jgi:hypothetical protein